MCILTLIIYAELPVHIQSMMCRHYVLGVAGAYVQDLTLFAKMAYRQSLNRGVYRAVHPYIDYLHILLCQPRVTVRNILFTIVK